MPCLEVVGDPTDMPLLCKLGKLAGREGKVTMGVLGGTTQYSIGRPSRHFAPLLLSSLPCFINISCQVCAARDPQVNPVGSRYETCRRSVRQCCSLRLAVGIGDAGLVKQRHITEFMNTIAALCNMQRHASVCHACCRIVQLFC